MSSAVSRAPTGVSRLLTYGTPQLADWPGGLIVAATCVAALLVLFLAEVGGPGHASFGGVRLVFVAAAAFTLSMRLVVSVVAAGVLFQVLSATVDGLQRWSLMFGILTYLAVAWLAYVAAGAVRSSRRDAARAERLRAVVEAATGLVEVSLSPEDLMERLMVYSASSTDADRGSVSRIEGDEIVVEASYDPKGDRSEIGIRWNIASQPLVVDLMKSKSPIQGAVVSTIGLNAPLAQRMRQVHHVLVVPLLSEHSVRGLLTLIRFRDSAFSDAEIESVQSVAKIASVALSASRLHSEMGLVRTDAETTALQLREREHMLADTLRVARLGSWERHVPRNQVNFSDDLNRIYGRATADQPITYQEWLEAAHADDRDLFNSAVEGAVRSGGAFEVEHRMVGPDGAIRNLQTFGRVVRIESGRPVRLAGTCQDVTERKHSEEYLLALTREREDRLREHARRMETLDKLKGEFLLLASHELRGPLTIITGYISLMRDGALGPLPEVVQAALPVMATQSAAMKQLISEMLETARLEHGLQLELRPLDLRELMLEAVQSVTPLLGAQQRLTTGAMSETVPILGDRERLLAIITNLLDNAIKYSGPRGEIACEVAVRGSWVIAVVQDNGFGIGQEDRSKLFTRFGRVVSPENAHIPGTGLGLYIAQGLAVLHGGEITVESQLGKGSTFSLRLPVAPAASPDPGGGQERPRAARRSRRVNHRSSKSRQPAAETS